jgi:P2-related tail formation protein
MPELVVQPSINDRRGQSLLQMIERLGTLDLTPLLVYRLDSTPDSALLSLAWQFDMLATQWQLGAQTVESIDALTDIDSLTDIDTLSSIGDSAGVSDYTSLRALLMAAIPLHRTRGTPYAIKAALSSLGWTNVILEEGQTSWGGTQYPASQGWAVFRVALNLQAGQGVAAADPARVTAAVNFFKPVRALLDSIWFNLQPVLDESPTPIDAVISIFSHFDAAPPAAEVISGPAWPAADLKAIAALYNKRFYHIGVTYGANQVVVADSGVVVQGTPIASNE